MKTAEVTNAKAVQKLFPSFPKITDGDVVNILKREKKNKSVILEFTWCKTGKLSGKQICISEEDFNKNFEV